MPAPANPWASDPSAQITQPPDAYVAIGFVDNEPISAAYVNWALSNFYGVNLCVQHSTGAEICIDDDGDVNVESGTGRTLTAVSDTAVNTTAPSINSLIDGVGTWTVGFGVGTAALIVEVTADPYVYFDAQADRHRLSSVGGVDLWVQATQDGLESFVGMFADQDPLLGLAYRLGASATSVKMDMSPRTGGYTHLIASGGYYQFGNIDVNTNTLTYGPIWTRPVPLDQSGSQNSTVWRFDELVVEYYDGSNTTEDFYVKIRKMNRTTGAVTDVGGTTTINPANTAAFITVTVNIDVDAELDTYTYFCEIYNKAHIDHSGTNHLTECRQVFKRISLTMIKYAAD
jgi:hypothetical protein